MDFARKPHFFIKSYVMEIKRNNRFLNIIIGIVGFSPFLYWVFTRINQDSWWDELISIKDYALVSFEATITTYPDPNNHVLFNLINNLYTRLFMDRDFYEILDSMYILRALQAFFALVTIYYSYLIVKKFFSKNNATIVVGVLCSTVPFLNFSLQLRGYNISMMFTVMLIFHAWNYFDGKKKIDVVVVSLLVFLLLYTTPSNVYFLGALCVTILFNWKRERSLLREQIKSNKQKKKKQQKSLSVSIFKELNKTYFKLGLAVLVGMIFTYIAYLPVIENILNNRFVSNAPEERGYVLTELLPIILQSFISARWFLLLLVIIVFLPSKFKLKAESEIRSLSMHRIISLIFMFLLPFLFAFIHNKLPFQRTFVLLAPVFAILLSIGIIQLIERLKFRKNYQPLLFLVVAIFLGVTGFRELNKNDKILKSNLQSEIREQNIYRNFYLAKDFTPHDVAKKLAKINRTGAPVLLLDEIDRVSLVFYLEKYDLLSQLVIRIQKQNVNVKGQKFNHVGLIQKSVGKNQDIEFMKVPSNLSMGAKLNPYLLLLSLNRQSTFDKHILLSAYPNRVNEFIEETDQFKFTEIDKSSFVGIYEVENK